jgi:hypothetical protein
LIERSEPERAVRSLYGGSEYAGRKKLKPAASTDRQWECRAAHVTAKATPATPRSGKESVEGLPGVWGAARVQGSVRNRRDPSAQPWSGTGASYKPKAKGTAAQRESEGIIGPVKAVKAAGGKGPCGGRAEKE